MASGAKRAGTKTSDVFAPVSFTAWTTVSKTGMPSTSWPPLPGVTPATTSVPYARLRSPWNDPSRPVRPETRSFVSLSTMIAISPPLLLRLPGFDQDLGVAPRPAVLGRERQQQCTHPVGLVARAAGAREPVVGVVGLLEVLDPLELDPGLLEHLAPLVLRVAAHMRRVAELLRLFVFLGDVERVLDHELAIRHPHHLAERVADRREVVRRDPRDD